MTLEAMQPTPTWDADAHADTVAVFEALAADEDVTVTLWCRDNCSDCRRELPDVAAAIEAAEFPEERLRRIPVDDDNDGELTDEYGVERIPTIVVERSTTGDRNSKSSGDAGERDADEIARFVEEETLPAAQFIAEELRDEGDV